MMLMSVDGLHTDLNVWTLLSLCSLLVFPLVGYIWKQNSKSKDNIWKKIDLLFTEKKIIEDDIHEIKVYKAVLDKEMETIRKEMTKSVNLLELRQEFEKFEIKIEDKLDKRLKTFTGELESVIRAVLK